MYSTACGHGTIALGAGAADTGRVLTDPDGVTDVTIDVPSGRVVARVARANARTALVTFRNVASRAVARDIRVETTRGRVTVGLSGAAGAAGAARSMPRCARDVGLSVDLAKCQDLIAIGREVKWALHDTQNARQASDDRLSGVYGTIVYDDLGDSAEGPVQRNVTIYADGAADRSPCGSGTAARVALLAAYGRLGTGQSLRHHSIVGTTFIAPVAEHRTAGGYDAVIPEVDGMAYRTGERMFVLDGGQPGTGFVLR